jgi:hypothetical protein
MAAAMLDRVAPQGYLMVFQGESYRMAHGLMTARQAQPLRTCPHPTEGDMLGLKVGRSS